ncbi:hypothetical protein GCM10020331_067720 [Ectobacillus funiculus]
MFLKSAVSKLKKTAYTSIDELKEVTEASPVRCLDEEAAVKMMQAIDDAKKKTEILLAVL